MRISPYCARLVTLYEEVWVLVGECVDSKCTDFWWGMSPQNGTFRQRVGSGPADVQVIIFMCSQHTSQHVIWLCHEAVHAQLWICGPSSSMTAGQVIYLTPLNAEMGGEFPAYTAWHFHSWSNKKNRARIWKRNLGLFWNFMPIFTGGII
jgi:hypothetical protein